VNTSDTAKTVAVLLALPEEHEVFQEIFPANGDVSCHRCVCLEHQSPDSGVRLVSILAEQMGAQSAGHSAEIALREFNPDLLVVLGIAGGVSTDLSLGDVCVSNEIIDVLQNNKVSGVGPKTEISFAPNFYSVDADLVATFAFLRNHPADRDSYKVWREGCAKNASAAGLDAESYGESKLAIGPIACGPVSASKQFNEKLKSLHRKVMAIETESGGVRVSGF
jgi:adenosylhomocysteine nucleosidase